MLTAAAALLCAAAASAAERDLAIATRGETSRAAWRDLMFAPLTAASDIGFKLENWEGGLDALRAQAKAPDAQWDLMLVDAAELAVGCAEGLFDKLDWAAIGGKDHYQPAGVAECGVGARIAATVLAWDKDKSANQPTWADFWDVAKMPGKRGLRADPRGTLEIALLADGVAAPDVYKTLATPEGADRAFRKLDQLKPYLSWWRTGADAAKLLESGDVAMTSAPSGRIAAAARETKRNFAVQWAGSLTELQFWAMVKGGSETRATAQVLYALGGTAAQARMLRLAGEAGLAKGVNEGQPPEVLAFSPSHAANAAGAMRVDAAFWAEHGAKLRARFEAWMAGR
jgi:putative spermidine/putrescine transport system substrate-binding protein